MNNTAIDAVDLIKAMPASIAHREPGLGGGACAQLHSRQVQ